MLLICRNKLNLFSQSNNLAFQLTEENGDLVFVGCLLEVVDVRLNLLDVPKYLILIDQKLVLLLDECFFLVAENPFGFFDLLLHFLQVGD